MKSVFAMLLVVFVLSACSPLAPAPTLIPTPTFTPVPSPTVTLTATLVPSPTPEPPGTFDGMDTTQYGFEMGELKLNGNEIVYSATGEVAAIKENGGVWQMVYGPDLIKHLHKVAKLGEMRNGEIYKDQAIQDHISGIDMKLINQGRDIQYDDLVIRKPNGYIESYSRAWVQAYGKEDIRNNLPHDVVLWIEPPTHQGEDLRGLIKILVTGWINPTIYD